MKALTSVSVLLLCLGTARAQQDTTAAQTGWQLLAAFEGTGNTTTEPFKIRQRSWKIEWEVTGTNRDAEFVVIMYNQHNQEESEIIATQVGPGTDRIDFEGGGSTYYLDVSAKLPFRITVWEFH